ncbi:MAG: protein kinase domain-containing protein, partial [Acidimicrobiales bacterium]
RRLGRQVAITLLLPETAAQSDLRSRFEAEARAAASLLHPDAVAVFDTGEYEGVAYIVMERLPGESLADRIADGPVDPAWLTTVATEVLGALGAAHDAGLMHRDVKPGNILLAADGRAKVADFGIAKSVEAADGGDLTTTGQLLGTPAYLAPERLDGTPAGPRSDLWALGVVLYEALAGAKPFTGPTALATARAVTAGDHRPLAEVRPDLDPGLVATVERAMARDPAARFATAADMAAALAAPQPAPPPVPGPLDDTVDAAAADHTMVLGDTGGPAATAPPDPSPTGPRRDALTRALAWAAVAGVVLVIAVLLVRSALDDDRPQTATSGPPTSASQATTTAPQSPTTVAPGSGLARQLRDAAAGIEADGGPLAATLAGRLRGVADQVQAGGGGTEATAALVAVVGWDRAGQLSGNTAASVIELLRQVPGIDQNVLDALTTPATTTGGSNDNSGPDPNREKNKNDD